MKTMQNLKLVKRIVNELSTEIKRTNLRTVIIYRANDLPLVIFGWVRISLKRSSGGLLTMDLRNPDAKFFFVYEKTENKPDILSQFADEIITMSHPPQIWRMLNEQFFPHSRSGQLQTWPRISSDQSTLSSQVRYVKGDSPGRIRTGVPGSKARDAWPATPRGYLRGHGGIAHLKKLLGEDECRSKFHIPVRTLSSMGFKVLEKECEIETSYRSRS